MAFPLRSKESAGFRDHAGGFDSSNLNTLRAPGLPSVPIPAVSLIAFALTESAVDRANGTDAVGKVPGTLANREFLSQCVHDLHGALISGIDVTGAGTYQAALDQLQALADGILQWVAGFGLQVCPGVPIIQYEALIVRERPAGGLRLFI
jgi:hypothetical protein